MALYLAKIFGDVEKAPRAGTPTAPAGTNESAYVDERRALAAAASECCRVKRVLRASYWEYKLRKIVKEAAKVALKKAAARTIENVKAEEVKKAKEEAEKLQQEEEDEQELERLGIKVKGQP